MNVLDITVASSADEAARLLMKRSPQYLVLNFGGQTWVYDGAGNLIFGPMAMEVITTLQAFARYRQVPMAA